MLHLTTDRADQPTKFSPINDAASSRTQCTHEKNLSRKEGGTDRVKARVRFTHGAQPRNRHFIRDDRAKSEPEEGSTGRQTSGTLTFPRVLAKRNSAFPFRSSTLVCAIERHRTRVRLSGPFSQRDSRRGANRFRSKKR